MWLGALALIVAGGGWWRSRHMRAMVARTMAHRRLGPDGIVIGGEGFELSRPGAPAVLLLHGGGDTPQTLRYLADELHARGFHVVAPLLPGHGRTLREFARVTADELSTAAAASYATLRREHDWVAVIGLSMGGALAAQLAADNVAMPALGLVAPYLAMPTTRRMGGAPGAGVAVHCSRGELRRRQLGSRSRGARAQPRLRRVHGGRPDCAARNDAARHRGAFAHLGADAHDSVPRRQSYRHG